MKLFYILAIVLLLSFNGIAQQATAHLHLQVVDQTGAVIPDAQIIILDSAKNEYRYNTNNIGEADFNFIPGKSLITIKMRGFSTWSKNVEYNDYDKITEIATMKIGISVCGPCVAFDPVSLLSTDIPDLKIFIAEIPLQVNPIEIQCNLKGRKCKPIRAASH